MATSLNLVLYNPYSAIEKGSLHLSRNYEIVDYSIYYRFIIKVRYGTGTVIPGSG
jgi:hypothetical protein